MSYELFERSAIRVDTPVLSIAPGGKIAINAAGCRVLLNAGIASVVIFWDKGKSKMAIKAAPKGERNAFTITFTGGNHSASIAAKSFLNHIGWSATKRETLATTWNADLRMFEVVLPSPHVAPQPAATKKRTVPI